MMKFIRPYMMIALVAAVLPGPSGYAQGLYDDGGKNVTSGDLNNQELSKDPQQRTRQLDYQAQRDQERETS